MKKYDGQTHKLGTALSFCAAAIVGLVMGFVLVYVGSYRDAESRQMIEALAKAQGYTLNKVPEQKIPEHWEATPPPAKKNDSVPGDSNCYALDGNIYCFRSHNNEPDKSF